MKMFKIQSYNTRKNCLKIVCCLSFCRANLTLHKGQLCNLIFILEFFSRSGMTIRFIFHGVPYGGNKEQIPIRLKARAF